MNVQTESPGKASHKSPLLAFESQLSELCRHDKYREMAESYSDFVTTHTGVSYLAFEPIPARISDHLIEKTHSPSAFMTLTLRKPTWVAELRKALADPASFEAYVTSLESDVLEIAQQAKKPN